MIYMLVYMSVPLLKKTSRTPVRTEIAHLLALPMKQALSKFVETPDPACPANYKNI